MNRKVFFLFLLCCAFGAPLFVGCGVIADKDDKKPADKPAPTADSGVKRNAAGETVVTLNPEMQKRIELKVAALETAQQSPEVTAYGSIMDPATLVTMQGDLSAGEASLEASRTVAARDKKLFEQAENVSRKSLEAAENDERSDEIKMQTLKRNLALEWGDAIAKMDAASRQTLIDQLSAHTTALARLDLPSGDILADPPTSAQVLGFGESHWRAATILSPATRADPKTLGQGFIVQIDDAKAALAPGAPVTARLKISGSPRAGVAVPDSAVVRAEGKTWIYIAGADNQFTRHEMVLDAPLENGWFVTNGLAAGDRIVVEGAALLLSEEQKTQIQTD